MARSWIRRNFSADHDNNISGFWIPSCWVTSSIWKWPRSNFSVSRWVYFTNWNQKKKELYYFAYPGNYPRLQGCMVLAFLQIFGGTRLTSIKNWKKVKRGQEILRTKDYHLIIVKLWCILLLDVYSENGLEYWSIKKDVQTKVPYD